MGWQDEFSWAGVAAAGVGAGVGFQASEHWVGASTQQWARSLASGTAAAIANAATRSALEGSDFDENIRRAIPDVIGQTIGEAIAGGIGGASSQGQSAGQGEQPGGFFSAIGDFLGFDGEFGWQGPEGRTLSLQGIGDAFRVASGDIDLTVALPKSEMISLDLRPLPDLEEIPTLPAIRFAVPERRAVAQTVAASAGQGKNNWGIVSFTPDPAFNLAFQRQARTDAEILIETAIASEEHAWAWELELAAMDHGLEMPLIDPMNLAMFADLPLAGYSLLRAGGREALERAAVGCATDLLIDPQLDANILIRLRAGDPDVVAYAQANQAAGLSYNFTTRFEFLAGGAARGGTRADLRVLEETYGVQLRRDDDKSFEVEPVTTEMLRAAGAAAGIV